MSQIQLDRADIQKSLDWAFAAKKLPNKCLLKGDAQNLRVEVQNLDLGRFVPNISPDFTVWPSLDGQDLLIKFQGESSLSKFGGILAWMLSKVGVKLAGEFYKVEPTGDTVRIYLGKITLGQHGKLGDLVHFHNLAWANNRLELDFKTR